MTPLTDVRSREQRTRWVGGRPLPFRLWFPISIYLASRVVAAAYMIAALGRAHRSGYSDLATAWDGDWYRYIATTGYPSSLPVGAHGQILQNPWAFSPGYPMLVRVVMAVTGQDFSVVAPTLSLVLGAAAAVVVFVLLERAVSRFYACTGVILLCAYMAAPVLQVAYSESLALLLLAGALLLLRERKYVGVATLLLLLALTRPVVLAFIPVVIAHGVARWRARASDPFPAKDRRAVVLLTGCCIASTLAWPVIVGICTRDIFTWTKTEDAWRGRYFGPGLGWPGTVLSNNGWPALVLLGVIVLLTVGIVLRRGARAWGPELRSWAVAYPAFLLLTTVPLPSVIRWTLLAFPLLWPFPEPASSRSEQRFRVVLIIALAALGLALQWVWVSSFLGATAPSVRYP